MSLSYLLGDTAHSLPFRHDLISTNNRKQLFIHFYLFVSLCFPSIVGGLSLFVGCWLLVVLDL